MVVGRWSRCCTWFCFASKALQINFNLLELVAAYLPSIFYGCDDILSPSIGYTRLGLLDDHSATVWFQ